MARQDALQGSLPLLVLTLLARRGPLHGYGLATQIEAMSDDTLRVEEGSLYPALHRLEEAGWIKARWKASETGRRARVYEMTAAGRTQLESEEARWKAITAAVGKILKHA
jgi:PadR family transcriptional regulator, regulatory protein PadR